MGSQWNRALRLLDQACHAALPVDHVIYHSTLGACVKAVQWEQALNVWNIMDRHGGVHKSVLQANAVTHRICIPALFEAGQIAKALEMYRTGLEGDIFIVWRHDGQIDLHHLPSAVATVAVYAALEEA